MTRFSFLLVALLVGLAQCLRPQNSHKIVGGYAVNIENYPYQVSFQYNGQHFCGGSIVSENYVVTAAHCAPEWADLANFTIRAGSTFINKDGVTRGIKSFTKHPKFSKSTMDYDVALLELDKPLEFTKTIKSIELSKATPSDFSSGTVTGWGRTSEGGSLSYRLQAVTVPITNRYICGIKYSFNGLTDRMMCAGKWLTGGQDACQGDSGGPLANNGKLVGVVSWGVGCARSFYPGIYTNVAVVRDFILDSIKSNKKFGKVIRNKKILNV